jgi:muramidase (phage lysozyme)
MFGDLPDAHPNRAAFLDLIGTSEGTVQIPNSDDGYRALVGGGTFENYADHPRQLVHLSGLGISSTAAGRYQVLAHIFDFYKASLKLLDFSPTSQDRIAMQLITECNALADIDAGDIQSAILKCASRWASFPTNPDGQHQQKMEYLLNTFQSIVAGTPPAS